MSSNKGKRVVVVGAGMGGLVSALELACQGLSVVVFDKACGTGGKLGRAEVAGRFLDCGPTVLTMPWVFEEIFQRAGVSFSDRVALVPLDKLASHSWTDGGELDLYSDVERNALAIENFAGRREADGYRRFAKRAEQVFDLLEQPFMRNSCSTPLHLMHSIGLKHFAELWRIAPFSTLHGVLEEYFRDPRLIQLFGRYATYCGSSPYSCPATLMLVTHAERRGVWSVEGGMAKLAAALTRLCIERGVEFRENTEVTRVVTASKRVTAVELAGGDTVRADVVVMNADANALPNGCFGSAVAPATALIQPSKRSLSAITWCMMARASGRQLARHNVFFSNNYRAEFDDLFKHRQLPQQPTVYICAQDRDAEMFQPLDSERLFCLVNAPADGDTKPLQREEIARCQQQMLTLLSQCGLTLDFEEQQVSITTPSIFNQRYPASGGALYGRASHGWTASFQRAQARTKIAGLYLAGGSVHPGPGLPMAALSGSIAAQAIVSDLALTALYPPMAMPGGISTE
jgi:1-hydroxycarotenoid 3,4-desaturase